MSDHDQSRAAFEDAKHNAAYAENFVDKRSYFRLDLYVRCSYRIVSREDALVNPLPRDLDATAMMQYFSTDLSLINQKIDELMREIGAKSPLLANLFAVFNTKMDAILEAIDSDQLIEVVAKKFMNLSAGGVLLEMHEDISETDKVDLLFKLGKDIAPIMIRAMVTRIDEGFPHKVALEFEDIMSQDRQYLTAYLFKKQIDEKRALR